MPYKLSPHVACLVVRGPDGKLAHHYQSGGNGANRGPYIPYLDYEQRPHFLRLKLVEEISEAEAPVVAMRSSETPQEDGTNAEVVEECIRTLDEADVPSDAGRPTCQKALRDRGFSYGSETLAAAVRQRKLRAS